MKTTYNFSPGPGGLPQAVREKVKEEWLNWNDLGTSVAEISHHSIDFKEEILFRLEKNLRALLQVPDNYKILFLHGGAQGQFAAVPMNLLGKNKQADYLVYGHWSSRACDEAQRYGDINQIDILSKETPCSLMTEEAWSLNSKAAYLHYCSNETISGIRLPSAPTVDAPLIVDMSSDILSQPIDVTKFGIIYACAQKNMGISGLATVIIRDDLLDQAMAQTPSIWDYKLQVEKLSLQNTINTFGCYITSLVVDWVQAQGGLQVMAEKNSRNAEKLYRVIDASDGFYKNEVANAYRSLMNVKFHLPTTTLDDQFVAAAQKENLLGLKGHHVSGGVRASIYNAMPELGVDRLVEFMEDFRARA